VPYGADQTIYLVIDRLAGSAASAAKPKSSGRTIEGIIAELLAGQLTIPSASWLNTLSTGPKTFRGHRPRNSGPLRYRGESLPDHLQEFVENYRARRRHLSLSWRPAPGNGQQDIFGRPLARTYTRNSAELFIFGKSHTRRKDFAMRICD